MRARESTLASDLFGDDLEKVIPAMQPGGSDSATFDNALELLVLAGRSLPHALMMMVPEAWENHTAMPDWLRDFYAFHACLMEPWDGPASVAFCDGTLLGATLDRNGLRPGRWQVTKDDFVVMASETGVLEYPADQIVRKGRLAPGKIFMVDLDKGRVVEDGEIKHEIAHRQPYGDWFRQGSVHLDDLEEVAPAEVPADPIVTRQLMYGYSQEDLRVTLRDMGGALTAEPTGSMGNDFALAVLSDKAPALYGYFKQLFAQVTNPPIDPIRERVVMSLESAVGPQSNLFESSPEHAHQLIIGQPLLRNFEIEKLKQVDHHIFSADVLDATWPVEEGPEGMARAMERLCRESSELIAKGDNIIVISDRAAGADRAPIPALLATAGVHHHLVREGTRLQTGLVVESAEPREVHHICCLLGYGASAVNPYLALETLRDMFDQGMLPGVESADAAEQNYVAAMGKGVLKTISKMGISTVRSYAGAQIFEAVGLNNDLIDTYFTHTTSRIGGIGIDELAIEALARHRRAYPETAERLPVGGVHQWRRFGERHQWNPETIALVQHAVRHGGRETYEEFSARVNDESRARMTLRGLLKIKEGAQACPDRAGRARQRDRETLLDRRDVAGLDLVDRARDARDRDEPPQGQVEHRRGRGRRAPLRARPERRLAPIGDQAGGLRAVRRDRALPRQLGPDADQDRPGREAGRGRPAARPQGRRVHREDPPLDTRRGPDLAAAAPRHLLDRGPQAADLRPPDREPDRERVGEARRGGRRRDRRRRRGEGELRPRGDRRPRWRHGRVAGQLDPVGRRAVGDRARGDAADTVLNKLRDRIIVQTDGQMKTGRDVVIAALLGAEEMGFATAPLIAMGCIMMRACHLNTCPVGVATQDPDLIKKFKGEPEQVVNYFFFVAEEVRRYMAQMGFTKFEDMIGRTDMLEAQEAITTGRRAGLT